MKIDRKIFVLTVVVVLAVIPWVFISNQYSSINNIPHNSVTMWNFILNYLTFFVICFFVVAYFMKEPTEEYIVPHSPPPPKMKKTQKNEDKEETKEKTTKSKKTEKTNKKSVEKDGEKG